MTNAIKPVEGAAIYEAGYDNGKPCVWMTVLKDEHCEHDCYYVVQNCQNISLAMKAAEKWQKKENNAVNKSLKKSTK